MTTALAPHQACAAADRRMAAFLKHDCPEIFHSVATPTAIWQADPYDVESIHAEAREAFERLLHRGGQTPPPPSGAVLVLLGEAGSGKTHLMRAFRTRAHSQGLGYCGYLQMTTEASNYARYMLTNLIEALESPYSPVDPMRTGMARLSTALLEYVPGLGGADREALREDEGDPTRMVDDFADRLHATQRFQNCDLELLRVMLHLARNLPQVRSRALMWLRCQAMRPQDCEWIGNAIPRTDDADPIRMLQHLALLTDAVHFVPLILLIDQLEDMANQSAPVERFRRVVDAITAFTDQVPNAVVVLACLEDYFWNNISQVIQAKRDRLVRDPAPIKLSTNRTFAEIRAMTARRLAYLYEMADVEIDQGDEVYPFREAHLAPLAGLRARDVLDYLRQHHDRCIEEGRWEEPNLALVNSQRQVQAPQEPRRIPASPVPVPPAFRAGKAGPYRGEQDESEEGRGAAQPWASSLVPRQAPHNSTDLDSLWNDFHTSFNATIPDGEEQLAWLLADAIRSLSNELSDGLHICCEPPDGGFLAVEAHGPYNTVARLLIAVCNRSAKGGGLGKQLAEVEKRLGDSPVALVRTTEFPTGKASIVAGQVAAILKRDGRKVVVADADLRRMLAFDDFRKCHHARTDFAAWQKSARALSELHSLQAMLRLSTLAITLRRSSAPNQLQADSPRPVRDQAWKGPQESVAAPPATPGKLIFGQTRGLQAEPISCEAKELTQHAAFLGGSGSGKTTAALNLIEQLLAQNIPAVLVDRKGDLCRYADQAAWQRLLGDPARAALGRALWEKLDIRLFTPGEPSGRPLSLPVVQPGFDELTEADRERYAQYAAAALGSMMGFKSSDKDKGQRAILAKSIETLALVPGSTISVPTLRDLIECQDDALLNAIGGGYPSSYFENLAQRLLTLELNNRLLLTVGEKLDVDALLGTGAHARPGRVRLSLISTRFLGDWSKVDFWVSQLLVAVSKWCARFPQPRLQAVFLFDEADNYLPAVRQPATKAPMEDLLKRARSAGVGIFLATQSPGDFDYRCKENVRTWLIGRVKEPRAIEKLKPMLAAAESPTADLLPGQATGDFYLVRESTVTAIHSNESLIRTEQMSESEIVALARSVR